MRALTIIRVTAGLAALAKLFSLFPVASELAVPTAFRAPVGLLPYPSAGTVRVLGAVWLVAALLLVAGLVDRVAAGTLAALTGACLALDAQLYSNHLYLLALMLAVWAAAPADARLPSYRWLVALMYAFAAVAKVNLVYLSGGLLATELGVESLLPWPDALRVWWVLAPLALTSVLVEAYLALALWSPARRRGALATGVTLHAGIVLVFSTSLEIVVFAAVSLSLYSAFFPSCTGAADDSRSRRRAASPRAAPEAAATA